MTALLVLLSLVFSGTLALADSRVNSVVPERRSHVARGNSITLELKPMPEKYQIESGQILDLFTASADSSFWCGPNSPHPYSWLSSSIICRAQTEFEILFCTAEGDSIEALAFVDIAPGTYRVNVGQVNRPEDGIYLWRFLHRGAVVHESKIHIQQPR